MSERLPGEQNQAERAQPIASSPVQNSQKRGSASRSESRKSLRSPTAPAWDESSEEDNYFQKIQTPDGKRKRAAKAFNLPGLSQSDVESDKHLRVTALDIEQKPHLKNWKRWAAVKDSLKLKKLVEGKVPSLLPDRLDALLSQQPLPGKNWEVENVVFTPKAKLPKSFFIAKTTVQSDHWVLQLKNADQQKQSVAMDLRKAFVPCELIAADDQPLAERCARELCHLLNRLPIANVTLNPDDQTAQLLVLVSVSRAKNEQGDIASLITADMMRLKKLTAFKVTWDKTRKGYRANLQIYGQDGLAYKDAKMRIKLADVSDVREIPSIPDALTASMPAPTYPDLDLGGLKAEEQILHQRAVQLCHYMQYVMFGACGDKDELMRQAYNVLGLYKVSKDTQETGNVKDISCLYDGRRLFALNKRNPPRETQILPSKSVCHDVGGVRLANIHVLGHSKARVSTVIESIVRKFAAGGNILDAWQAGVLMADKVNKLPAWKQFVQACDHTDLERVHEIHICQGCNGVTFCFEMSFATHVNLRVCMQCEARSQTEEVSTLTAYDRDNSNLGKYKHEGGSRTSKEAKVSPAVKATSESDTRGIGLKWKLMTALRSDMKGPPHRTLEARRDVADKFAEVYFDVDTGEWLDGYIDNKRPDKLPKSTATRTSGFLASADAAELFHVEDGRVGYHVAKNVIPTAAYANQACNTWLKSHLQVIKDAQALRNSVDINAYRDINNRLDHLWAIRTQYPWLRKSRLEIAMAEHQFQRCQGEWRRGVMDDPSETIPYYIHYKNLSKPTWTVKDHERFDDLIDQMYRHFDCNADDFPLKRGKDGAPFPWRPEHMPGDWSWAKLEAHMAYHFQLMDDWCDEDYETDEDPETLLLELIWQWIDNGGKDPYLRLPMTVFAHHAAGWAIGHVHHGLPMRTRWRTGARITNIDQRDDKRCNVVMEPRIANYMKMDYAEDEYQLMLDDLMLCEDETEWFTRPKEAVPALRIEESVAKVRERSNQWVPQRKRSTRPIMADDSEDEFDVDELEDDLEGDVAEEGDQAVDQAESDEEL